MKHPFDVHVGGRLRHCRCSAGMTQQQLGDKLCITAQEVQDYEVGANQISANHMRDIVVVMEVPASFFYEGLALALGEAA